MLNLAYRPRHAWLNRLQSVLRMAFRTSVLALLGLPVWGAPGLFMLFLRVLVLRLLGPVVSPWLVPRPYRASPLHSAELPALYDMLAEIAPRRTAGCTCL